MVANLDVRDALADRLDDTTTLVTEHDGEVTLGVVARELSGGSWVSAPIAPAEPKSRSNIR